MVLAKFHAIELEKVNAHVRHSLDVGVRAKTLTQAQSCLNDLERCWGQLGVTSDLDKVRHNILKEMPASSQALELVRLEREGLLMDQKAIQKMICELVNLASLIEAKLMLPVNQPPIQACIGQQLGATGIGNFVKEEALNVQQTNSVLEISSGQSTEISPWEADSFPYMSVDGTSQEQATEN